MKIECAFADKAYRGKDHHPDSLKVFISGTKKLPALFSKILKSRSAIEPVIGHLKNAHRLGRNYLLGKIGGEVNAILSGLAFNLKKIINALKGKQWLWLYEYFRDDYLEVLRSGNLIPTQPEVTQDYWDSPPEQIVPRNSKYLHGIKEQRMSHFS